MTFQLPAAKGGGRGLSPGIIEIDIFHCRQKATKIAKVNFQFSSHRSRREESDNDGQKLRIDLL